MTKQTQEYENGIRKNQTDVQYLYSSLKKQKKTLKKEGACRAPCVDLENLPNVSLYLGLINGLFLSLFLVVLKVCRAHTPHCT